MRTIIKIFHFLDFPDDIEYSDKYYDDVYEYRHVILPKHIYKKMPRNRLLTEVEWRALGYYQNLQLLN